MAIEVSFIFHTQINVNCNMAAIVIFFLIHANVYTQKYWKHTCQSLNQVTPLQSSIQTSYPASNYLFKVNNRNTRTRCEICSKLTIKTPERRQWGLSGVFIVSFEHISEVNNKDTRTTSFERISDLVLVFLLLTLNR